MITWRGCQPQPHVRQHGVPDRPRRSAAVPVHDPHIAGLPFRGHVQRCGTARAVCARTGRRGGSCLEPVGGDRRRDLRSRRTERHFAVEAEVPSDEYGVRSAAAISRRISWRCVGNPDSRVRRSTHPPRGCRGFLQYDPDRRTAREAGLTGATCRVIVGGGGTGVKIARSGRRYRAADQPVRQNAAAAGIITHRTAPLDARLTLAADRPRNPNLRSRRCGTCY